ncbi:uncharacterized protein Ecym_1242 [Eremothecium cymbalariae DBVPG|uniref:DUF833-domain-containing protein n=1 Tax=Eremothecium cymbalariae (strain CBS 270.75 / DBVPG 7215 / KCTC 17166 / NRRL Y-17582) TaxID=931890 RepID=G8JN23_ERECY|nr:hypothetical protein Ecym_1242 [Eremothecium cymbalariae DBVPG\
MCILLATTDHPDYKLILISNRDEFYERRTHVTCWHQDGVILAPYDISNSENASDASKAELSYGTWLGINRVGHVSVLLNLKEVSEAVNPGAGNRKSRGNVTVAFLRDLSNGNWDKWNNYEKFSEHFAALDDTQSFTLFYGDIKTGDFGLIDSYKRSMNPFSSKQPYVVISNSRVNCEDEGPRWKKVVEGEQLLKELVKGNLNVSKEHLLQKCFELAGTSQFDVNGVIQVTDTSLPEKTIFVPTLKAAGNSSMGVSKIVGEYYGTRTTIVILVDNFNHVTMHEHVIHDSDKDIGLSSAMNPKTKVAYEFDIQ